MSGSLTFNLSYRNPSTDLLESNPISGGSFTPTHAWNWNGRANGAAINQTDPVYVSSASGYGALGNTSITRNGHSSSLELKIRAGSDGLQGGTGGSDGMFGFQYYPATTGHPKVPKGQSAHFGFHIFIPTGFDFNAPGNDTLKFIRVSQDQTSQRLDIKVNNGQGIGGSTQAGWFTADEEVTNGGQDVLYQVGKPLNINAWNYVEYRLVPSDDPNTYELMFWCNDSLVFKIVGKNWTRYDNSDVATSGTFTNGMYNLNIPTALVETFWFCTYWNGNAPQTQSVYIDSGVYYTSATPSLPTTDSHGNPMIGSVAASQATL